MRLVLATLILLILLAAGEPAAAETPVQGFQSWVEYTFNEQISFRARFTSSVAVESAVIFFQGANDNTTIVQQTDIITGEADTYETIYTHLISDYTLRPFSQVTYHWEISLVDGQVYTSPPTRFFYDDNRFNWRELGEKPFRVHWSEGDLAFAQNVLDTTQNGLSRIQALLPLPAPAHLDIYVYPDARSLQPALQTGAQEWVAGHAAPDLGVIVVSLPEGPEQRLLMQQRLPHELMHIMLYQYTRQGYKELPTWLNEGLASLAELYPNPDYPLALQDAAERDSLLPLETLCHPFPRDAYNALLAYAESASFTRYLLDTHGAPGLQDVVTAYANGLDCQSGVEAALGRGLEQLERDWRRQALAEQAPVSALGNLLPWLILLAAILAAPVALLIYRLWQGRMA